MCVKLRVAGLGIIRTMRLDSREKGVYLLLLEAHGPLKVGRLGVLPFDGWYVYVGSALGPGGLKRLQRHFDYCKRPNAPMRWHVDALLGAGGLRGAVVGVTEERLECGLAEALGRALMPAFKGFGSSDCGCGTHLFVAGSCAVAMEEGRRTMAGLGLVPRASCERESYNASNSWGVKPA